MFFRKISEIPRTISCFPSHTHKLTLSLVGFSSKLNPQPKMEKRNENERDGVKETKMEKSETSNVDNRPWQSYHTVYTNAKAGMDGVDKEKVQRVVYEMSKGSKYFENEERKEAFIRQKIEHMRARCAKLTPAELSHYQEVADKKLLELEATRDLSRIWIHVDMDAFYAAVETLSNPSLRGKPMAVGGMSMLSTANYEARRYGVRAAMPGFIALKLCPELTFVPTDFKKYTYYSDLTRKVFRKYDPNFMAGSLDEAYLDITEVCKERGISGGDVAEELRFSIYEETGLTCSAGVAPNRLIAKVCSDINKPNGQFVLPNDRNAVVTFISSLPIRKIGGIGKVTEHLLRDALGINACEELLQKSNFLCALFSPSTADFFLSVGLGVGRTDTPHLTGRKSISNERTFSPTENRALLFKKLAEIAEMLSIDMHKEGVSGRTLTLKLKTTSFEIRTRAVTLQRSIFLCDDILKHASKLLKAELPVSLRLIGLRMSLLNEDKTGTLDPTQKTLTNFIVSGDAVSKKPDGQGSLGSEFSENHFINDLGTRFSADSHVSSEYQFRDQNESIHLQDQRDNDCSFRSNSVEVEINHESSSKECTDMVDALGNVCGTPKVYGHEVLHVRQAGCSLIRKHEDGFKEVNNSNKELENEHVSSSKQIEPSRWVDDYKCSLCGFELPLSFAEERQEHSDFHLAEMLQKEESNPYPKAHSLMQRIGVKTNQNHSKRKKLKSSPKESKNLPIDMFFAKSSQNF